MMILAQAKHLLSVFSWGRRQVWSRQPRSL